MEIDIIAFDVPLPADYGGAIDVFYRLQSLHAAGAKITLHCFEYGRGLQPRLDEYCHKIHYYPRTSPAALLHTQPYIVRSRRQPQLLHNLTHPTRHTPIIFEGIHTCAYLRHPALSHRQKWVRIQNIEPIYYKKLAEAEPNIFKKIFYLSEAIKIKYYEKHQLQAATGLLTISTHDHEYYKKHHKNAVFLPAAHPHTHVQIQSGTGSYVLYHANLSVAENTKAAQYIAQQIATQLPEVDFVIAGKDPPTKLQNIIKNTPNVRLIPNPNAPQMHALIANAHIHLLITFQATGIKLKALASLHTGRHCIVNPQMVAGAGIDSLCIIVNNAPETIKTIKKMMPIPFDTRQITQRQQIFDSLYNNADNAQKLLKLLDK